MKLSNGVVLIHVPHYSDTILQLLVIYIFYAIQLAHLKIVFNIFN